MLKRIALAAYLALPVVPAFATDKGQIVITGTASVTAIPDIALVSAGVETTAQTAREALSANTTAMQSVFETAKKLGIEERDIQTSNFNIGPNWEHGPTGSRENGFAVSNQVTLRLRDVAKVGEALDALVSGGANRAGGVQFVVSDADERLDTARREAVTKAKARAELYAAAADVELGEIISIREGADAPVHMPMYAEARMASDSVPVAAGEQELSISVTITWALDD